MTRTINQILSGLSIGGGIGAGLGVALQNWTVGGMIGLGLAVMWVFVFIGGGQQES
jgi:hypothetical protein